MSIDGIALSRYRSFGEKLQLIGPFSKINIFIGPNNAGKSNILLFFRNHLAQLLASISSGENKLKFNELDWHKGVPRKSHVLGIALPPTHWRDLTFSAPKVSSNIIRDIVDRVVASKAVTRQTSLCWFVFETSGIDEAQFKIAQDTEQAVETDSTIQQNLWGPVMSTLKAMGRRRSLPDSARGVLEALCDISQIQKEVVFIPAFRGLGERGGNSESIFGTEGLIRKLASLERPNIAKLEDQALFEHISRFVRTVLRTPNATIQVPSDQTSLHVIIDGRTLPLEHLGTGVHEVIMLAVAATVARNKIVCFEEPELHLHPILQKELLNYLNTETDNQYFITTHSAHILDTPSAAVFHVSLEDNQSVVRPVFTDVARSRICDDLGYRASDLLQSNCVIWVEGPSDRIYLNHWIKSLNMGLVEGLRYSIMFYGGSLLSHLTVDEDQTRRFIELQRLNRHPAILMDSDRAHETADINTTKKRIMQELGESGGFAWVTQGRTIENYVSPAKFLAAVQQVHKKAEHLAGEGQYADVTRYVTREDATRHRIDKIGIAQVVAASIPDLSMLDLCEKIGHLVEFIKRANGIEDQGNNGDSTLDCPAPPSA